MSAAPNCIVPPPIVGKGNFFRVFTMDDDDREGSYDLYRDTPVRLLGYANEVGESFRALVPASWVHFSYALAVGYVLADTANKVSRTKKRLEEDAEVSRHGESIPFRPLVLVASDTLLWQGLASVAVPGLTINRLCALSLWGLRRCRQLSPSTAKWTSTTLGLAAIPCIMRPIDHGVTALLDATTRKWTQPSNTSS